MIKYVKSIALTAALALPIFAGAATLHVAWTDPTPAGAAYTPNYTVEYQVNSAAPIQITGKTTPDVTATIAAVATDTVKVRYQAVNVVVPGSPVTGPWTTQYTVTPAITPGAQPAPTTTIIIY